MKCKGNRIRLFVLLILCMGIGFAYLTSNLNITGNTSVSGNKWDVYFDNIQVKNGSVEASTPTITNKTTVNYSVTFDKPGDYYEFTVDAVNDGTIDAMIDSIEMTEVNQNFINYEITYGDGEQIKQKDVLETKEKITYKIFIEYKRDIEEESLLEADLDLNLSFTINYVQSNIEKASVAKYGLMWNYDYTGEEETMTIPISGTYTLEVWGAQGGYGTTGDDSSIKAQKPGYGGYSVGNITLSAGDQLYINVGGKGNDGSAIGCNAGRAAIGGYNGGGNSHTNCGGGAGGGATHIATTSGLLSTLSENKSSIIIVAGGAGGAAIYQSGSTASFADGSGGGYIANNGITGYSGRNAGNGGTQTSGGTGGAAGTFGKGGNAIDNYAGAGGGGYYGGGSAPYRSAPGGGGSGYIGNSNLTDKVMYCYQCSEPSTSDENYDNIKTISTESISENPVKQHAKKGNGYAKITYIENSDININLAKNTNSEKVNNINFNTKKGLISFETTLTGKEDYAELVLELENVSDKDYYISKLLKNSYDDSRISYTITYSDESEVSKKDIFRKNSKETIIIKVQLLDDNIELNNETFSLEINHKVAKENESYNRDFWNFDYTGEENTFTVEKAGIYKLEVWGAAGAYSSETRHGGYGGYSVGQISLNKNDKLYINVGGQGSKVNSESSYNGGGSSGSSGGPGGGGGATHIATSSGILSTLKDNTKSVIIVAGGGGGFATYGCSTAIGGSGGGYIGMPSDLGGTQNAGGTSVGQPDGSFGQGAYYYNTQHSTPGAGGGWYGGGTKVNTCVGGGGSGYIGNTDLYNKTMYCYNCQESSETDTKTISTTNVSEEPISNYAKMGNGYIKISFIGTDNVYFTDLDSNSVDIEKIEIENDKQKISFPVTLNSDTNMMEFSVQLNNFSKKDLYINNILKNEIDNTKLDYSINYVNGEKVEINDSLNKYDLEKLIIKVKLLDNNISVTDQQFYFQLSFAEKKVGKIYNKERWKINYTGAEQTFTVPYDGKYKLEVWGAAGGTGIDGEGRTNTGGYGGYSTGTISLTKDTILNVVVGGKGIDSTSGETKILEGGYNGGGGAYHRNSAGTVSTSGGGATHIATTSGVLSSLSNNQSAILIVAGGGGGVLADTDLYGYNTLGGSGGGYIGGNAIQIDGTCSYDCTEYNYPSGGTQSFGGYGVTNWKTGTTSTNTYVGTFGKGATGADSYGGGGGGYYGGASGTYSGGGGGSGYIGNSLLKDKSMYCYNCNESSETDTKTISTINFSKEPTSFYAKQGNGYAKITYLGE